MKNERYNSAEWQLMRERLHISDLTPPIPRKKEAVLADILPTVLGGERPDSEPPPPELLKHWDVVVGGPIAKHTKPTNIKNKILYVYSDHPGWLNELRRHSKEYYLKKLSAVPELPEIRDIRFLLDPNIKDKKRSFPKKNR
jgi:hypothetical protein